MSDLQKIDPDKIEFDEENIFLTLGLMRNDFSDIVHLQSLQALSDEVKKAKEQKDQGEKVSPEIGRATGTQLYILRHGLSYLYSSFEFLREKSDLLEENIEFKRLIHSLSPKHKEKWKHFLQMASDKYKNISDVSSIENDELLNSEEKIVTKAAILSRHIFTYHYHHSTPFLSRGLEIAYRDRDTKNTEWAFLSDPKNDQEINIRKYRSYYIDLAFQKYLEDQLDLNGDLYAELKDPFFNVISHFSLTITMILKNYHDSRE